ncbi:MAG: hypothetical protein ACYDH6_01245 [Acidimicrobiales bacterium]
MEEKVCGNCARPDPDLVAVHRVYLEPEMTLDEVEWWCFSCRSMYPHEVVENER